LSYYASKTQFATHTARNQVQFHNVEPLQHLERHVPGHDNGTACRRCRRTIENRCGPAGRVDRRERSDGKGQLSSPLLNFSITASTSRSPAIAALVNSLLFAILAGLAIIWIPKRGRERTVRRQLATKPETEVYHPGSESAPHRHQDDELNDPKQSVTGKGSADRPSCPNGYVW